jgi:hypothetical protein
VKHEDTNGETLFNKTYGDKTKQIKFRTILLRQFFTILKMKRSLLHKHYFAMNELTRLVQQKKKDYLNITLLAMWLTTSK